MTKKVFAGDRGPPRTRQLATAAEAVSAALAYRGISEELRAQRVITEWADLVGERIAARARPDRIIERILHVEVTSSAWLHELSLLRLSLLTNLVKRLGEPRLFDDLRFRLAGRTGQTLPPPPPRPRAGRLPDKPPGVPASGPARARIVDEASAIDDAELRALVERVRITADR